MFGRLGTQQALLLIISYLDQLFNLSSSDSKRTKAILEAYKQTSVYHVEPGSSYGSPRSCHPRCTVGVFSVSGELSLRGSL